MEINVSRWVKVEAANGDPQGKAVLGAVVYDCPELQPGTRVQVADNPLDAFKVGYTCRALGVIVLEYTGDVDLLALGTRPDGTPASGATIIVA